MSNIVFLTTIYLGKPSANGICARNLINELRKMENNVDIICYEDAGRILNKNEDNNKSNIYTINYNQNPRTLSSQLLHKVKKRALQALGFTSSVVDESLVEKYYQKLLEIDSKKKIDVIVAMYFPLESVQAMTKYKSINTSVKTLVYELDSVADGVGQSRCSILTERTHEKWLTEMYYLVDYIFIMQSHLEYWKKRFRSVFGKKLHVVDIPVLLDRNRSKSSGSLIVEMIYAGVIDKKYRSPSYMLSVFRELSKYLDFEFSIFSKGDCEEEIVKASKEIKGVMQRGFVSSEELDSEIMKSDILISLGNSFSNSVPSKLLTYIAYGKPIIHFSSQLLDVCDFYLKNYPLALVIRNSMPIEESSAKILSFINETKGREVDIELVKTMYLLSTPFYSAMLIHKLILRDIQH